MSFSPSSGPDQSRHRHHREHHRDRSDAAAHADDALNHFEQPMAHPLVPAEPARLITTTAELIELVAQLRAAGSFAFDSEFIGEMSYIPKLCLIQTASPQRVCLIDPLADIDLSAFWDLLRDPDVEKIVHAGQQDVEPLFRDSARPPANLFDTQLAAGMVGLTYPLALSKLVQATVGHKLKKGLTFTHWDRRPLSAIQLRYGADDVRYLPAVRQALGHRLAQLGHESWASEESAGLADPALYRFDAASQALRTRGSGTLSGQGMAIIRALLAWREESARAADVPPRTFLRDDILIEMSRHPIKQVEQLHRVRGLPRPVEAQYGQHIVEITRDAQAQPATAQPEATFHEPPPGEKFRADSLWALTQCLCTGQQLDPALVTSRQEIGDIYYAASAGRQDFSRWRIMTGWRRQAIGQRLLDLLSGRGKLSASWVEGGLKAVIDGDAVT